MKTVSFFHRALRSSLAVFFPITSLVVFAADQTVTGNLTVTGTTDLDGNTLTFGTQSTSPGLSLTYANADVDTLTNYLNRSPASWLWAHSSSIAAMRLTANHELVLYKTDGTTAGVTFTPATNTISLGATTLYRDSSSGALRTNGALTADGAFSAPTFTATHSVNISSTNPYITFDNTNYGGLDYQIYSTSSGSLRFYNGADRLTLLPNGDVGIGTSSPVRKLDLASDVYGLSFEAGTGSPYSGAIRFGDNTGWKFVIGRSRNSVGGALNSGANAALVTVQDNGNVGIGTTGPQGSLDVSGVTSYFGTSAGGARINATGSGAGAGAGIWLRYSDNNAYYDSALDTIFRVGTGISLVTAMRIKSDGTVGIGVTAPSERLDVSGNAKFSGKVTANSARFDGPVRIAAQGDLSMGTFTSEP